MAANKTYEVTWKSGSVEKIEATSVNCPVQGEGHKYGFRAGQGHVRFFKDMVLVLSADENDIKLIRLVSTSTFVKKTWDNGVIEVEQKWLDRAKYLLKLYGPVSTIPARLLELEMGIPSHSGSQYKLLVIAGRELHAEGYKHRSVTERCCPLCR